MATKTIPVNNYNDSNNYGTSGAAPSLYSDKHYLDGDGFLYGLGMASQRMIVKGKTTDIDTNFFLWNGSGTSAKLDLDLLKLENALQGAGLTVSAGRLNVNVGQGLYIGTQSSSSSTMNKVNINLFKKNVTFDGATSLYNTSGLEFVTGTEDTSTGAPAAGQLRINVDGTTIQINEENKLAFNRSIFGQGLKVVTESGQQYRIDVMPGDYTEIKTMGDSGNQYTAVDVNIPALFAQVTRDKSIYGIGITPNSDASHSNNLYIDGSVLAGDGLQGTGYSDSDSTITPKLKLKIANGSPLYIDSTNKALNLRIGDGLIVKNTSTTPTLQFAMGSGFKKSGESIDVAAYNGITVNSNGVSVKPKSNAGIAVDANGVSVKIKSTSGIGVDSNGIYLKAASESEIGGVKTGTPATIQGANPVNLPLFLDSNNVGNVRMYVFNSKAPSNPEAANLPYSASYIDTYYSTKTEVTAEIASAVSDISGREYKIFTDWPAPPTNPTKEQWDEFYTTYKKYIALKSTGGTDPDAYEERILIRTNESTGECRWEKIGDTKFTTDNFVAKTDVLTQDEVASIVKDVFGF